MTLGIVIQKKKLPKNLSEAKLIKQSSISQFLYVIDLLVLSKFYFDAAKS